MNSVESQSEIAAAIKEAVSLASNPTPSISKEEALMRVSPTQLEAVLHTSFEPSTHDVLTRGLGASPGAAVGKIVLSADEAMMATEDVILVREETNPADVHGMQIAVGILTTWRTCKSRRSCRSRLGKPAVCGAANIELADDHITINGERIDVGEALSIDGTSGTVMRGAIQTAHVEPIPEIDVLLQWADEVRERHSSQRRHSG